MPALAATTSNAAATAIAAARSKIGSPYVWGAEGPSSSDCSGLVRWAYLQAGIDLPHQTASLLTTPKCEAVAKANLQPGDLVFPVAQVLTKGHVTMYTGNGKIIEAANGIGVREVAMYGFVYARRVKGAQSAMTTPYYSAQDVAAINSGALTVGQVNAANAGQATATGYDAHATANPGDFVLDTPLGSINLQGVVNLAAKGGFVVAGLGLAGLGLARLVSKKGR